MRRWDDSLIPQKRTIGSGLAKKRSQNIPRDFDGLHAVFEGFAEDVVGFRFRQSDDVDVRDAGVFALRLADGPAHDLDGGEAFVAGELQHVGEFEFGERMAVTKPSFMVGRDACA